MQALQRPQQCGTKASNPEQALQRAASHFPVTGGYSAGAKANAAAFAKEDEGDKPMKRLLVSAAFSAMLLSPAFAQSYSSSYGTGNAIDLPSLEHGGVAIGSTTGSFAYEPPRTHSRQPRHVRAEALSPSDPDTVYENGQYVGRDPDPNVRLEMRRDWTHD
jgi:hypothetical protein